MRAISRRRTATAVAAFVVCLAAGCGTADGPVALPEPSMTPTVSEPTTAPPTVVPAPDPVRLVRWHGPVEALFVHPLILRPRLAFHRDAQARGFLDYFITAYEFRALLDELWRNGWTLVDVHRAAAGTVRVPEGRKPLVLYEDDANYYDYFRGHGLARRLVLDGSGRVRAELPDGDLSTADVVPLVEEAVAAHPELSAEGAKGVLALTGFEGLLGEHDPQAPAAHARLVRLADRLRAEGWTFASHTNGHIDLSTASPAEIREDSARWRAQARSVLGPVDVLVYPYGARPSAAGARELVGLGFPIQIDIDIRATRRRFGGAVLMSRRHVDGFAFAAPARQRPFYSVKAVRDPRRP